MNETLKHLWSHSAGFHSNDRKLFKLPSRASQLCRTRTDEEPPYLPEVPDVKKVEGVEQVALLHPERVAARRQEGPDVLQTQELWREYYY